MTIIDQAREVFAATPAVLTNHGLTRTALRWLERHGYVTSHIIQHIEHSPITDKATGLSMRRRWEPTARLWA